MEKKDEGKKDEEKKEEAAEEKKDEVKKLETPSKVRSYKLMKDTGNRHLDLYNLAKELQKVEKSDLNTEEHEYASAKKKLELTF